MAHVPIDDAELLFGDNRQKSWSGLLKVLQQRKGKAEGISDNLIDLMIPAAQRFEQSGKPYPNTAEGLQEVLNDEIAKVPA
jgi:hypothetical protein